MRASGPALLLSLAASLAAPGRAPEPPTADGGFAAVERALQGAALAMDGCPQARDAAERAAALSAGRADDAAAAFLEGQALALARSLCGRSAADPAPALERAARLGEPAAAALWALVAPGPAAWAAVEAARSRSPADAALALAAASRSGLDDAAALALLDGARGCVPGLPLRRGELFAGAHPREAAAAFRAELYGACPARWVGWHGDVLALRLRARLGLAAAAIALGDGLEARRQLALARFGSVDGAIGLPADERDVASLERRARKLALPRLSAHGATGAVLALERAALAGDLRSVRARLGPGAREAMAGCEEYRGTPQEAVCILDRLLPEAPAEVSCKADPPGRCTVTGAAGDQRSVRLVGAGDKLRLEPE